MKRDDFEDMSNRNMRGGQSVEEEETGKSLTIIEWNARAARSKENVVCINETLKRERPGIL